jgi:hypothetical protein
LGIGLEARPQTLSIIGAALLPNVSLRTGRVVHGSIVVVVLIEFGHDGSDTTASGLYSV